MWYKVKVTHINHNISDYSLIVKYNDVYQIFIQFLYEWKNNVVHPNSIYLRDLYTMEGGYLYKNSTFIFNKQSISYTLGKYEDSILSTKFSGCTDEVLRYIDEYCGIYKPTIICDFKRVKANP